MNGIRIFAASLLLVAAACGPRMQPPRPIMDNGAILESDSEAVVADARAEGNVERAEIAAQRDAGTAAALASCAPDICDAITRGEIAIGMSEAQVLAATRTTSSAWDVRGDGGASVMVGRLDGAAPADAVGEIAFVHLQGNTVQSYTYREPQGFRTVASPFDATLAGQAAARADALLRQGDEYAAAGDLDRALDRYDRADIIRPNHPETTLRIASVLDKSLRPIEAIMRYQLFIHQLELELIEARGDAAAKFAEAIARARERIIVLEHYR